MIQTMDRFERKIISGYLAMRKAIPAKLTHVDLVTKLIRSLRPVETGHEMIRIGPDGDGGYLLPDDLSGVSACFSPGVGEEYRFEADCINRGMKVLMADASVQKPIQLSGDYQFRQKYIGAYSHDDFITLDQWVSEEMTDDSGELLLQMDIEGAEYEVVLGTSQQCLKRFRIMVIEFHRLEQWWNRPYFEIISKAFGKILDSHACVHSHPNVRGGLVTRYGVTMPRHVELTFMRRDRLQANGYVEKLPRSLDSVEFEGKRVVMPEIWYT